jgi:hypothetical protein
VTGYAKALTAVLALFVVCLSGLGLVVYLSRSEDALAVDNVLAESLTRAFAVRERVDFDELADFPWERVLLVETGTPSAEISAALGTTFTGELNYDAGSTHLFVFAGADRVLRFADYRGSARFEGFGRPIALIARSDARFRVRDQVVRLDPS